MTVRTRMAPSPTGEMHVGSLATALKNYAFAKRHGGSFILRIEDTDKTREVEGGIAAIQDILKKYSIFCDEGPEIGGDFGPYIQSERLPIYQEYAKKLVADDKAYYCFCSQERIEKLRNEQREKKIPPKYDGLCKTLTKQEIETKIAAGEKYVIRLKVPSNQEITFDDWIHGPITINSDIIDDQVLIKSDGFPTYHMAVVVDDHLMGITHIMRGEEWISSTPKHILLYKAFGWDMPVFAHIPVFLNPDGKGKMSKRHGDVSAQSYLDKGYLPEALLNFFMILGWAKEDQVEVMTLEEYIKVFDPRDLNSKPVAFDIKKLNWINGVYIRKLSLEELTEKITPFLPENFPHNKLPQILPLIHERLEKLSDVAELTDFFYTAVSPDQTLLLKKSTADEVKNQLEVTKQLLSEISDSDWNVETLETTIRELQEKQGWKKNQYFMMLRLAATGKKATPPLFDTLYVIGKKQLLERLTQATIVASR